MLQAGERRRIIALRNAISFIPVVGPLSRLAFAILVLRPVILFNEFGVLFDSVAMIASGLSQIDIAAVFALFSRAIASSAAIEMATRIPQKRAPGPTI